MRNGSPPLRQGRLLPVLMGKRFVSLLLMPLHNFTSSGSLLIGERVNVGIILQMHARRFHHHTVKSRVEGSELWERVGFEPVVVMWRSRCNCGSITVDFNQAGLEQLRGERFIDLFYLLSPSSSYGFDRVSPIEIITTSVGLDELCQRRVLIRTSNLFI